MTLAATDALYQACQGLELHMHRVRYDALEDFWRKLRALRRDVGVEGTESDWRALLAPLYRWAWMALHAVTPLSHPALDGIANPESMQRAVRGLQQACRRDAPRAAELVNAYEGLRGESYSRIARSVASVLAQHKIRQIVVPFDLPDLLHDTEIILSGRELHGRIRILRRRDLLEAEIGEPLMVLGSLSLFPAQLSAAPRANPLHVVSYRWFRESASKITINGQGKATDYRIIEAEEIPEQGVEIARVQTELIGLERMDLDGLLSRIGGRVESDEQEESTIERKVAARLFRLAGNAGILFEEGFEARVFELDGQRNDGVELANDSETGFRVMRLPIEEIVPGMFLIERGRSSGPALDTIIEQLLGEAHRNKLEQTQSDWKSGLRRQITLHGRDFIAQTLRGWGCSHAQNPQNVTNWASDHNFLPSDSACFRAIMILLKQTDHTTSYWENGKALQVLSRAAGNAITELLLQEIVRALDRTALERDGISEVTLAGVPDASITLFRVEDCPQTQFSVPRNRTRAVFHGLSRHALTGM